MIASGPACADTTTCEEAWHIVEKYNLKKIKNVVAGGSERYESVYNGLKEVTGI